MPARGHSTAPTFGGKAIDVKRYFDDLEQLFDTANIGADNRRIHFAKHYIDTKYIDTWDIIEVTGTTTWDAFKAAITTLYPGAERDRRYARADLEKITEDRHERAIEDREELGEYYRAFSTVAHYLIVNKRISEGERDRLFIKGFQSTFRQKIYDRLAILSPNSIPEDGYEMETTYKAATFLLTGARSTTNAELVARATAPDKAVVQTRTVKEEPLEDLHLLVREMRQIKGEVTSLVQGALSNRGPAYQGPPSANQWQPRYSGPPPMARASGCHFCSGRHFLRECPEVERYLREGRVERNPITRRLELPGGRMIPRVTEMSDIKTNVDEYYKDSNERSRARDPPPHISANLFEVADDREIEQFLCEEGKSAGNEELDDDAWAQGWMETFELEAQKRAASKKVRHVLESVEIPATPAKGGKRVTFADKVVGDKQTAPAPGSKPLPKIPGAGLAARDHQSESTLR